MSTLSTMLREATAVVHDQAENSDYVRQLMNGSRSRQDVAVFLAQHLVFYRAMEQAQHALADDPLLVPFLDRELERTAQLEADLAALHGATWATDLGTEALPLTGAAQRYAQRLAGATPEFVLANHYVRYLGDLSGGQILARMMNRHYGIPADELSFYHFDSIPKPKVYKDGYRERLDAITDPATMAAVVEAAIEVFDLNRAIFEDLSRQPAPRAA